MERWMPLALFGLAFGLLFVLQTIAGLRRSAAFQKRLLEDSELSRNEAKAQALASREVQERLLDRQVAALDRIATSLEQRNP